MTEIIGDALRIADDRALAGDDVLGVLEAVAEGASVAAARQLVVLIERPVCQGRDVIEVERSLGGDALSVGVLILHGAEDGGIVEVEQFGYSATGRAEDQALGRRRGIDVVCRVPEVLLDELTFGEQQGLDDVAGEKAVLRAEPGGERQLGDPVRDDREVGDVLNVLAEELEEAGVVDGVIVVVPGVYVEGLLGHGPSGHVQDISKALAGGGVQRLVHVGDALAAREVGRAEAGHAEAGGHGCCGVLPFGLEEDEAAAVHIGPARGGSRSPALAHLGRGSDGVCSRSIAGSRFYVHDR